MKIKRSELKKLIESVVKEQKQQLDECPCEEKEKTMQEDSGLLTDPDFQIQAVEELNMYIENDRQLYVKKQAIIDNLKEKAEKGRYSQENALRLWSHLVDAGAQQYVKEFGRPGEHVSLSLVFPKDVRLQVARDFMKHYEPIIQGSQPL